MCMPMVQNEYLCNMFNPGWVSGISTFVAGVWRFSVYAWKNCGGFCIVLVVAYR